MTYGVSSDMKHGDLHTCTLYLFSEETLAQSKTKLKGILNCEPGHICGFRTTQIYILAVQRNAKNP